ncbi:MAG: anion permease [Limisphaerales bacterium]
MLWLLFLTTCFLAYSNGANDNFKGVASLFGSKTTTYRTAITWATITTAAGSIAAIFLAEALLEKFSGKGLVLDALTTQPEFLLAVAFGAGATVILATILGFPISTTHGLTGALAGAGLATGVANVNWSALGSSFFLPLIAAPLLAVAVASLIYIVARIIRLRSRISKEMCICIGAETQVVPIPLPSGLFVAETLPTISVIADQPSVCTQKYRGTFLGLNAGRLIDSLHFLSSGAVSFARGLNDTPKIAALLLVVTALKVEWGMLAIAAAMALGGLLNARKVAHTMSQKITDMNAGQGFAANLATALLVNTASYHGLPVSTTHVSVGALLGIGITTRQAKWKPVLAILLSWLITLPTAALLAAMIYALLLAL